MAEQSKALTWTGRILTAVVAAMLTMSAVMKLQNSPMVTDELVGKHGYPAQVVQTIGVVELACVLIFIVPQTAVLGAVLLTGYFGGAIATHVRSGDNFAGAAVGGVLVWLALFLRDPRIRQLLPVRRA
ncbi:MAG: DoxX family protein [Gemmataceae bacterium]|nr:DoxX family protein [Gemmataceae bacterium]